MSTEPSHLARTELLEIVRDPTFRLLDLKASLEMGISKSLGVTGKRVEEVFTYFRQLKAVHQDVKALMIRTGGRELEAVQKLEAEISCLMTTAGDVLEPIFHKYNCQKIVAPSGAVNLELWYTNVWVKNPKRGRREWETTPYAKVVISVS